MSSYITLVHLSERKLRRSESRAVYLSSLSSFYTIAMSIPVQHIVIFVTLFPGMFAGMSTLLSKILLMPYIVKCVKNIPFLPQLH